MAMTATPSTMRITARAHQERPMKCVEVLCYQRRVLQLRWRSCTIIALNTIGIQSRYRLLSVFLDVANSFALPRMPFLNQSRSSTDLEPDLRPPHKSSTCVRTNHTILRRLCNGNCFRRRWRGHLQGGPLLSLQSLIRSNPVDLESPQ